MSKKKRTRIASRIEDLLKFNFMKMPSRIDARIQLALFGAGADIEELSVRESELRLALDYVSLKIVEK